MANPLENLAAIRTVIISIESNLSVNTTRDTQIAALDNIIVAHDVQMVQSGFTSWTPTGSQLRSLLRKTILPTYRRAAGYKTIEPDEVMAQLFAIGRTVLDDEFLEILNLPVPIVTTDSADPNARNPDSTHSQGTKADRKATSKAPHSSKLQPELSQKRKLGEPADDQQDETVDEQVPSPKRSKPSQPHRQGDGAELDATNDQARDADDDNDTRGSDAGGGGYVDIMNVPLELSLEHLHQAIIDTARVIFPDNVPSRLAQPDSSAAPELCILYNSVLFSNDGGWKPLAVTLLGQRVLTARGFFQSLIWAFIRTSVMNNDPVLHDLEQALDSSKASGRYINELMAAQYNRNTDDVRRGAFTSRLSDARFRSEVVKSKATNLASDLMLTLAGHFDQVDKQHLARNWFTDMTRRLVAIFRDALLLEGRFMADAQKWDLHFFDNGHLLAENEAKVDPRYPGSLVGFTIMPGLDSNVEGNVERRSLAIVAMSEEEI